MHHDPEAVRAMLEFMYRGRWWEDVLLTWSRNEPMIPRARLESYLMAYKVVDYCRAPALEAEMLERVAQLLAKPLVSGYHLIPTGCDGLQSLEETVKVLDQLVAMSRMHSDLYNCLHDVLVRFGNKHFCCDTRVQNIMALSKDKPDLVAELLLCDLRAAKIQCLHWYVCGQCSEPLDELTAQ